MALLAVPALLTATREEEAQARKMGLDKSQPKQYLFIKESLDALEAQHAAKERAAREAKYERDRRRLKVGGKGGGQGGDDEDSAGSEEEEDLRTKLSKMSDEEFKQLALERKKRWSKREPRCIERAGKREPLWKATAYKVGVC